MNRVRVVFGVLAMAFLAAGLSFGDDKKDPPKAAKATLPAHYKQLGLSDEQMGKIKSIHADFKDKIEDAKQQLAKLEAQQKSECLKVLTDAQKKKLAELAVGESSDDKKDSKNDK
jgi:predicted component of viral defense system (DUF524 family)